MLGVPPNGTDRGGLPNQQHWAALVPLKATQPYMSGEQSWERAHDYPYYSGELCIDGSLEFVCRSEMVSGSGVP